MILKFFESMGRFLAFIVYWLLASPLVFVAIICAILSIAFMLTRDIHVILKDATWRSKPLRWVNGLVWPNSYLAVLEKITGYYP
ncbi:hypothetical protein DLF23_22120 [Salmonella enterica subsp. enterica serovar Newport]|nr:hypothetical protein [Salmonella enterica subsp. enterica serovar Newport]